MTADWLSALIDWIEEKREVKLEKKGGNGRESGLIASDQ